MIYIHTKDARKILTELGKGLSKKQLAQAQSRAINRSLEKARTEARRDVKKVYNIAQKDLKAIDIKRSTSLTLTGDLHANRKPIPLDTFSPKQQFSGSTLSITRKGEQRRRILRRSRAATAGVSVEIIKGKREILPFAFLIPGGAPRVFARGEYKGGTAHGLIVRKHRVIKTGNDTPVKPLISLSVFGGVLNDSVRKELIKTAQAFYPRRLEYELEAIAKGLVQKRKETR